MSILPGFEYDIFISYRHNDNRSGWVTEFVKSLQEELGATIKEPVTVYFDSNPHEGLHDNYDVGDSLKEKLRCLVFIPIVSRTYCDSNAFAWQQEFKPFIAQASTGEFNLKVKLQNGNTASRVLPVRIHELETSDIKLFETEINSVMRPIDFVFKAAGVNRALLPIDTKEDNACHTIYRDQINKVANAIQEILFALKNPVKEEANSKEEHFSIQNENKHVIRRILIFTLVLTIAGLGYYILQKTVHLKKPEESGLAILPFTNNTGSPELDYYGVGMASEIRTKISTTNQFNFISSLQATLPYIKTQKSTKEIGEDLNVDFILSGLYQKAGNKIKVEAELLDAETGKLIWSIPFERELNDIFDVQREIAQAVLNKFSINTLASTLKPTQNLEAYSFYIEGYELDSQSNTLDSSVLKSIRLLKKALAIDSLYADAWAALVDAESFVFTNEPYNKQNEMMLTKYRNFVSEHFQGMWQKDIVDGIYTYRVSKHFNEAEKAFRKVLVHDKQNLQALELLASLNKRRFDFALAVKYSRDALTINPASGKDWSNLGEILLAMGDYKNALKAGLKSWELTYSRSSALDAFDIAWRSGEIDKLPENLKNKIPEFKIMKMFFDRKYSEVISAREKGGNWEALASLAYFSLNKEDSARYFANQAIQKNQTYALETYVLAGKKKEAFTLIDSFFKHQISSGEDDFFMAHEKTATISVLALGKDYSEATQKLIDLNKELPEFGDYSFFNSPYFDRIKKEYPPFQRALDNVKRQPMIHVEEIIKF